MQCLIPVMERTHLHIIAVRDPQGEKSSQERQSKHDRVDRLVENQVQALFRFKFSIPGHDPSADMGIHCDVQGKGQRLVHRERNLSWGAGWKDDPHLHAGSQRCLK